MTCFFSLASQLELPRRLLIAYVPFMGIVAILCTWPWQVHLERIFAANKVCNCDDRTTKYVCFIRVQGFYTVHAVEKLNRIPYGMKNVWTIVWNTIANTMTASHKLIAVLVKYSLSGDRALIGWNNPSVQHLLPGKLGLPKKRIAKDLLEPFKLHIDKTFDSFVGFKSALNDFQMYAYLDWP